MTPLDWADDGLCRTQRPDLDWFPTREDELTQDHVATYDPTKPHRGNGRVAHCGTISGYIRHRRHGEPACDACRAASRAATARRRAAQRDTNPPNTDEPGAA